MAESFENLEDIIPDWVNDDVEICLAEAVDKFEKQVEENDLEKILEQSQSSETKRNTKWVVKLFQGEKPLLCFENNKHTKQNYHEFDLFEKFNFSQSQNNCLHRLVSGKKHYNTTS